MQRPGILKLLLLALLGTTLVLPNCAKGSEKENRFPDASLVDSWYRESVLENETFLVHIFSDRQECFHVSANGSHELDVDVNVVRIRKNAG